MANFNEGIKIQTRFIPLSFQEGGQVILNQNSPQNRTSAVKCENPTTEQTTNPASLLSGICAEFKWPNNAQQSYFGCFWAISKNKIFFSKINSILSWEHIS